ncbi:MAG: nitroreductase family protein [Anaerolineae bacterium]|nr:nitroreductase family protein [Anaerolineae bacterium]
MSTYGFIKNPTGFILGATTYTAHSLEDFGYLMEYAVLYATSLDLGTVWLGGTFNKGRFADRLHLSHKEQLPAVIATGLVADKPRLIDTVIRKQVGARVRKSWNELFFENEFTCPLMRESAGEYIDALNAVQKAPSASNKQPWRILKIDGSWHFYVQRTPGYRKRNASLVGVADMQRIDMGIAMCHFDLMAAEEGLPGKWEISDPGVQLPDSMTSYTASWIAGSTE